MATATQLPTMVLKPPSGFRYDKTKDGWVLVEDVLLTGEPTLSLSGFLEEGESSVLGEVMLERGKANFYKRVGERNHSCADCHTDDPGGWLCRHHLTDGFGICECAHSF